MASLLHIYVNTQMFRLMTVSSLEYLLMFLVSSLVGSIWTCYPFHAELGVERCSLYSSLPGPLQIGQRAEMWDGGGGILELQSLAPVHLGIDHMNVVRPFSHIFRVSHGSAPWSCVMMVTF